MQNAGCCAEVIRDTQRPDAAVGTPRNVDSGQSGRYAPRKGPVPASTLVGASSSKVVKTAATRLVGPKVGGEPADAGD
jgi:hypothetical protein